MPERALEAEIRWRIWIIGREFEDGFEVAAVVGAVGIEDYEGDAPLEDVVVDQRDVSPGLFAKVFKLFLENLFGHVGQGGFEDKLSSK